MPRRKTSRCWAVTHFTEREPWFPPQMPPAGIEFMSGQLERAPQSGARHYQMFVKLDNSAGMNEVKRLLGTRTSHCEICRKSDIENMEYTTKSETRIGDPFLLGRLKGIKYDRIIARIEGIVKDTRLPSEVGPEVETNRVGGDECEQSGNETEETGGLFQSSGHQTSLRESLIMSGNGDIMEREAYVNILYCPEREDGTIGPDTSWQYLPGSRQFIIR